ncbi:hypothetical protein CRG98_002209, partial [Punica granatum]
MSTTTTDITQNGSLTSLETASSIFEIGDSDLLRLLDRPKPINVDRRSFDERSYNDVSISLSPRHSFRNSENFRNLEHAGYMFSPGIRSGLNTPRSHSYYETHPMIVDAWEALRKSIVNFRGQPVGTIAALDHSVEELNYDQ